MKKMIAENRVNIDDEIKYRNMLAMNFQSGNQLYEIEPVNLELSHTGYILFCFFFYLFLSQMPGK